VEQRLYFPISLPRRFRKGRKIEEKPKKKKYPGNNLKHNRKITRLVTVVYTHVFLKGVKE
jgi:hypothetical protein